jgi:O-methyltransferase
MAAQRLGNVRAGLRSLARSFPRLAQTYRIWRYQQPYTFSGWGMTTSTTYPPWRNISPGGELTNVQGFLQTDGQLRSLVRQGNFVLSQFSDNPNKDEVLDDLKWRHYVVYWSALYAAQNTGIPQKNYAECGVCDGLTVFYALSAATLVSRDPAAYLYDAWEGMKAEYLLPAELGAAGDYSYLSMEQTRSNLRSHGATVIFNKGYLPDSLQSSSNPTTLVWLHLDLNSALPTEEALKYFYDKVAVGGVVLLDDYGWMGYTDTKKVADRFFVDKEASLLQLPTGQAIVFKR